jgi:hypothetical protein
MESHGIECLASPHPPEAVLATHLLPTVDRVGERDSEPVLAMDRAFERYALPVATKRIASPVRVKFRKPHNLILWHPATRIFHAANLAVFDVITGTVGCVRVLMPYPNVLTNCL